MAERTQSRKFDEYFETYAPGVYLQEEFHRPIRTAFATGVPAFLGVVPPGCRQKKPVMLTLWFHFRQTIGEGAPGSYLAYAVRGFFENGGRACYVVPLANGSTKSLQAGLDEISKLNTLDLVCAPDAVRNPAEFLSQQQLVVDHCQTMRDRFAILDTRGGDEPDAVWNQWSAINGYNGAIYYPWVRVRGFDGDVLAVPPSGHVAGVYARTDHNRGIHKAPANEALEQVVGLERHLDDSTQAFLNEKRINCLRSFPGRGIRVWGARTLSGHDAWTYVNVRRLFLTVARWIDWHMQYVVFEPNGPALWVRIERDLKDYFYDLYRTGALKGGTVQEAFYVKCNQETNTPESFDRSEVVAEIGLAAANPYEFIVVRLIRGERGVRISEPGQPPENL